MGLEKIDVFKKQKGLTNKDLADLSGVPKDTIDKITSGKTKDPKLETVKAIVYALGFTLDDLDDAIIPEKNEQNIIKKYRSLDDYGKKNVDNTLNNEYERCMQKPDLEAAKKTLEKIQQKEKLKYTAIASGTTAIEGELTEEELEAAKKTLEKILNSKDKY